MRAWIDFRDEEERVKKQTEEDVKALDVRRKRLHELEEERLGLTDVCRYETTVVGEDEEIGPQGIETHARPPINGNDSEAMPPEDEPGAEARDRQNNRDLPIDLEGNISGKQRKASDQVAIIAELLRKRQRDERDEAEIRREEQVLLNKRLAMMEEQMQMLSKLIRVNAHREDGQSQATSPRQAAESTSKDTELPAASRVEAGAANTRNIIVVDDAPAKTAAHESADSFAEPGAVAGPVDTGNGTPTGYGATDATADDPMDESADISPESRVAAIPADTNQLTLIENTDVEAPQESTTKENTGTPDRPSARFENVTSISVAAEQAGAIQLSETDTSVPEAHESVTGSADDDQTT